VSTLAVAQPTLEGLEPCRTLRELVAGVWTELCAHRTVECPVCHGDMEPEYGAQALPVGGRCRDCGSVLN
jgi:DnaJ-class molecular chaperone